MNTLRTTVTFQSTAFNTTQVKDYFINDCCFGDDLAKWLIQELPKKGFQTDPEPIQEDWGWVTVYQVGNQKYFFMMGYRPESPGDSGVWLCWVRRKASILNSLFGGEGRGITPESVQAIHSVLSSSPQINNIKWHFKEDFDKGKEDLGQSQPV